MIITDAELSEIAREAGGTVYDALQKATATISGTPQAYAVKVSVLAALLMDAARMMQAGMEKQNGHRPELAECHAYVMAEIAECVGFSANVVAEKREVH